MTLQGAFVHLHNHSEYSLLDGSSRMTDIVATAVRQGSPAVAVTDHGAAYGLVSFLKAAKDAGVRPIIGMEAYVAARAASDQEAAIDGKGKSAHLVLLVRNQAGYQNLLKLTSRSWQEGYYYDPRIDHQMLAQHADGLIALSGCLGGEVPQALLRGNMAAAERLARSHLEWFGEGNYFLELQDHGSADDRAVLPQLMELSRRTGIPVVATNDSHYVQRSDARAHEVLLSVQTGDRLDNPDRFRFESDEFYIKDPAEMAAMFGAISQEALTNTVAIADRCQFEIEPRLRMPRFEVPCGYSSETYLRELVEAGAAARYGSVSGDVRARLESEMDVIIGKGFADYFLVVWDVTRFARCDNVVVGPGRGSAAGSLVAYALGITDVEPLRYGLLFERFLNESRATMPDIDLDFDHLGRERVIEYVTEKYGVRAARIGTLGTLAAKGSLRDVGRVLGLSVEEQNRLAAMVRPPGADLQTALTSSLDLREAYERDDRIREVVDIALKVEGLARNFGTHAAGVVISGDEPLDEIVPLRTGKVDASGLRRVATQLDMNAVAEMGLVKIDLLGLKFLRVMEDCRRLAVEAQGREIDWDQLPMDDPETFAMLCRGDTARVFQMESDGMRQVLRALQPDRFEDLAAVVALYRPGPLEGGMVDSYIARRHGKETIDYPHPLLEGALADTYGVIVYQEQVMKIAQLIAGFTMAEADVLRAAMSKKKLEVMLSQRAKFMQGAAAQGVLEGVAETIWERMEYFSGYGFNRSHAVAYGLISYRTAYLKAHYPIEYTAAIMETFADDPNKRSEMVVESRAKGVRLLLPDVNASGAGFTVEGAAVRFGLGAIKDVSPGVMQDLVAEREEAGRFANLRDLRVRMAQRSGGKLNRGMLGALVRAGALDEMGERNALLQELEAAGDGGIKRDVEDLSTGQASLFSLLGSPIETTSGVSTRPARPRERLLWETDLLGACLSEPTIASFRKFLSSRADCTLDAVGPSLVDRRVRVGGVVRAAQFGRTKSGGLSANVLLDDSFATLSVRLYDRSAARAQALLEVSRIVVVDGWVRSRMRGDTDPSQVYEILGDEMYEAESLGLERRPGAARAEAGR